MLQRMGRYGVPSSRKMSSQKASESSISWMVRKKSPDSAPCMMRWSWVEVSVISLPIPSSAMRSSLAPWNSAGYSMAPTPMMAPWPGISRGTECSVPMVPGLVSEIVVPWKSVTVSVPARVLRNTSSDRAPHVLVRRPELAEVHLLGALDVGHQELAAAVLGLLVDGEAEVDVPRRGDFRLA